MKKVTISLLSVFLFVSFAWGVDFTSGISAYDKASYTDAVGHFRSAVDQDPLSAEAWYNLGNAYYKSGSPGKAIAAYRKALKIKPGDADILFNLQFVNERTADKLSPPEPSLIVRLVDIPASLLTVSGWSLATLGFSVLGLILFLGYIFSASLSLKRASFFTSLFFWVLALAAFSLTAHRYWYLRDNMVVVTAQSASMLSEPNDNGTRLIVLKEGATLRFEGLQGDWVKVLLPDGSQAFVKNESVDII